MKASDLKTLIMGEFIYGSGYIGLFTESWGNSDVLGIRRSRFVVEWEVKVDKYDLLKELDCIKEALNNEPKHQFVCKRTKHKEYLLNESYNRYYTTFHRPNLFYFVVPMELEEIAIKGVEGTPYGVLAYGDWTYILHFDSGDQTREAHGFKESVKAKYLHKDKIQEKDMIDLVRKASTELYETRKRLMEMTEKHYE